MGMAFRMHRRGEKWEGNMKGRNRVENLCVYGGKLKKMDLMA
jgi:hypothetical protein